MNLEIMVRFITPMAGLILLLLSSLPGFSSSALVPLPSNTNIENSSSITKVFEKLELGMTYEQVVSQTGKDGQKIPRAGFVGRWLRKNVGQATFIIEEGEITYREVFGNWGAEIENLKTYAEIQKLLGEPIGKTDIDSYSWQDDRGCNMYTKFADNHVIDIQYICTDGKFGFNSGGLGDIKLQPIPSIPQK